MRAFLPATLFLVIGAVAALPFRRSEISDSHPTDESPKSLLDENREVILEQLPPSVLENFEEMSTPPVEAAPIAPLAQSYQELMVPLRQNSPAPSVIQAPRTRGEWERGHVFAKGSDLLTKLTEPEWTAVPEPVPVQGNSDNPPLAPARAASSLGFPGTTGAPFVDQGPTVVDRLPPPRVPPPPPQPRRYFIYEPE